MIVGATVRGASVAELRELIAAKDYQMKALQTAYAKIADAWRARDPAAQADWSADFSALATRYVAAVDRAQILFDGARWTPLPDSALPAKSSWDDVLTALRRNWNGDTETGGELVKGDMSDLSARLELAGGAPDYRGTPQPTESADLDLRLFKAADAATRKIEAVTQGGASALPWVAIGLVGLGVVLVARR